MVDLGQGDAVGDDRLAKQLVGIGHDVRSVQQMIIRQVADRTPVIVGGKHAVPERRLVQPVLDQAQSVAALDRVGCCRRGRCTSEFAKCDRRAQAMSIPAHNKRRNDGLVSPGRDAEEVDEGDLPFGHLAEPDILRRQRVSAHEA
jgi:hypothetical protein